MVASEVGAQSFYANGDMASWQPTHAATDDNIRTSAPLGRVLEAAAAYQEPMMSERKAAGRGSVLKPTA
jgi:hypothetical protein